MLLFVSYIAMFFDKLVAIICTHVNMNRFCHLKTKNKWTLLLFRFSLPLFLLPPHSHSCPSATSLLWLHL